LSAFCSRLAKSAVKRSRSPAMASKGSAAATVNAQSLRRAWLVHNLLGHPVMQLLALLRLYRWAFWAHDATVPQPRGRKR
jgi:hypothetical protein